MKKIISVLAISQLFISAIFSQKQKNDWADMQLRGKVKSVVLKETNRVKDEKNGFSPWKNYSSNTITFNLKGNKQTVDHYNGEAVFMYKEVFKYDDKGNNIESSSLDSNGKIIAKGISTYDAANNKIESSSFYGDGTSRGKTTYEYNGSVFIQERSFTASGTFTSLLSRRYDDKENEIEMKYQTARGGNTYTWKRQYDVNGNKTEETKYDNHDNYVQKNMYSFDTWGNIIEMNNYGADKNLRYKISYKYEYDKNHNWLKKTISDGDGEPYNIEERIIVYF